eukprot:3419010-Rhodomonas_salina.1
MQLSLFFFSSTLLLATSLASSCSGRCADSHGIRAVLSLGFVLMHFLFKCRRRDAQARPKATQKATHGNPQPGLKLLNLLENWVRERFGAVVNDKRRGLEHLARARQPRKIPAPPPKQKHSQLKLPFKHPFAPLPDAFPADHSIWGGLLVRVKEEEE